MNRAASGRMAAPQGDFQKGGLIAALCFVPVHYLKPGFDIGGAHIFMLQVIRMFPEIKIEDGDKSFRERRVLIWQRDKG